VMVVDLPEGRRVVGLGRRSVMDSHGLAVPSESGRSAFDRPLIHDL
jgi:hypothetical protein